MSVKEMPQETVSYGGNAGKTRLNKVNDLAVSEKTNDPPLVRATEPTTNTKGPCDG